MNDVSYNGVGSFILFQAPYPGYKRGVQLTPSGYQGVYQVCSSTVIQSDDKGNFTTCLTCALKVE